MMESTDLVTEDPASAPKEASVVKNVAGEEAGSADGAPVSEEAEVNGTQSANGHNESSDPADQEEPMDTSESPPAEEPGSTETTPVKTKAAMKDVSGLVDNPAPETGEEPTFDPMVDGKKAEDVAEENTGKSDEKAEEDAVNNEAKTDISEETPENEKKAEEKVEKEEITEETPENEDNSKEITEETKESAEDAENSEENAEKPEEKKQDLFDSMVSGQEEKPKDAFDSMLSGEKVEEKAFKKVDDDSDHDAFDSTDVKGLEEDEETEKKKDEEVVTVEDDGKPFESEEAWLKEYKSDEDHFASLDPEELDWYKENGPKIETAGESGLKCTSCHKNVTIIVGSHNGVTRHLKLGVAICKSCKYFYKDGSGWEKDDEGLDKYCRWCGQGGEIIICDKCPSAFCKRCLQRNLGRTKVSEITNAEEWKCLFCDPKQIYEQRATYHAVYQRFKSGNYKKPEVRTRTPAKPKPEPVSQEKIDSIMKKPRNFVDENIFEAFKTLNVYQKCLEQERERWVKNTKAMSVESAVSTCRALRKIYAITKQNMDLLDKAIVQSFVEKYPKDSVKIHMGKVGVKVKEGSLTGKPVSVKSRTKVKLKAPAKKKKPAAPPKRKVLPKKKKKTTSAATAASPKKGKTQEVVIMNGSPVYADPDDHDIFQVVRPSLSKKKAGPASKTSSKQLYTKKKATRYSSDDDSDVVTLSSDDERPSKPGPASRKRKAAASTIASPPKKRRPGPKSRTY